MHESVSAATQSSSHHTNTIRRAADAVRGTEHAAFAAQVLRGEELAREEQVYGEVFSDLDKRLLASGYPVAFPAGDLAEVADTDAAEEADAEVIDIRVGQLRRFLREMPALQSKVIRLYWGVGCERPHSQAEVAQRVGISQASVSRALAAGLAELCRRFEVPADIAA